MFPTRGRGYPSADCVLETAKSGVAANKSDKMYTTRVTAPAGWELTIGHTLPAGVRVRQVWLDGKPVSDYEVVNRQRGTEVSVHTRSGKPHLLTVITE